MIDVPAGHLYLGESIDPTSRGRTGDAILLDSSDLTTHGVIVGMTGSGKTGLGVGLLERAKATEVESVDVPLEKSDIRVTSLSLVWVPGRLTPKPRNARRLRHP
jgi:hypothetical protein